MGYLTVQPIQLATPADDAAAVLVLIDGCLAAVLSRLDAGYHGETRGSWFLEAGFGCCDLPSPEPHPKLVDAVNWLVGRIGTSATVTVGDLDQISWPIADAAAND